MASSMTTLYVLFCSSIFFTNFFFFLLSDDDDDNDHHRCRLLPPAHLPRPQMRDRGGLFYTSKPPLTMTNTHPLACDCVLGWAFFLLSLTTNDNDSAWQYPRGRGFCSLFILTNFFFF